MREKVEKEELILKSIVVGGNGNNNERCDDKYNSAAIGEWWGWHSHSSISFSPADNFWLWCDHQGFQDEWGVVMVVLALQWLQSKWAQCHQGSSSCVVYSWKTTHQALPCQDSLHLPLLLQGSVNKEDRIEEWQACKVGVVIGEH